MWRPGTKAVSQELDTNHFLFIFNSRRDDSDNAGVNKRWSLRERCWGVWQFPAPRLSGTITSQRILFLQGWCLRLILGSLTTSLNFWTFPSSHTTPCKTVRADPYTPLTPNDDHKYHVDVLLHTVRTAAYPTSPSQPCIEHLADSDTTCSCST